jgi:dipeptidyl aminopeptidase/acylaminoacyl peptidase
VTLRVIPVVAIVGLWACAPTEVMSVTPTLHVFSHEESKFIALDAGLSPAEEIPFALPEGCGMGGVYAAPRGPKLAIELSCGFGPAVLLLDTGTARVEQPITDSDSHFLAWDPAGEALYLKVNNVNLPQAVKWHLDGKQEKLAISEYTYDLAPAPGGDAFLFSYSAGMGMGSEMRLTHGRGDAGERIASDELNYLALARWSPDGQRIAFIRIPDSATPFTVGELWVMDADGSGARPLAEADAGHGTPPAWSPDGQYVAFVARENAEDALADVSPTALISNLYLVNADTGALTQVTHFEDSRVQDLSWMPGSDAIAFTVVVDDRMTVFLQEGIAGKLRQVMEDEICCASWLQR